MLQRNIIDVDDNNEEDRKLKKITNEPRNVTNERKNSISTKL